MASKKISQLDIVEALDGTEALPIVKGGSTVRATLADLPVSDAADARFSTVESDQAAEPINVDSRGAVGDGVTDDTAALTALLATNQGGALRAVSFTYGKTYIVSAGVLVATGVTIDLNGATVKVKDGTTMNGAVFQGTNRADIEIRNGIIDLNKANTTDPGTDTAGMAIAFSSTLSSGVTNCAVRRIRVIGGHRCGIVATSPNPAHPNEVTIENCVIVGCTKRGIYLTRPTRAVIRGNRLFGNCISDAGAGQIQATLSGTDVLVEGNTCIGAPAGLHHGMAFAFIDGLRVIGNYCASNSTDTGGVADGSGIVISEDCTNFTVTGNTCKANGAMGITCDVKTAGSEAIEISLGAITGNVCTSNGSHGIHCQYAMGVTIAGNTCMSNNGSGIFGVTQRCTVVGNTCGLNAAYGIGLANSATGTAMCNNTIAANHLYSNTTADFNDACTLPNDVSVSTRALAAAYRIVREKSGRMDAMTASTRVLLDGSTLPAGVGSATGASAAFYLDPADLAVAGLTAKLRIRLGLMSNSTAPASDFTVTLRPFTSPTGAAANVGGTLGAEVAGSPAAIAAPAANAALNAASADFDVPAAGWYVLVIVTSATMTASSSVQLKAALEARHV